jgi:hypothetical protein
VESPIDRLGRAIGETRDYLKAWEQPSANTAFETVRCLDDLFCRELFEPKRHLPQSARKQRSIMGWGTNQALSRIIPEQPATKPFRLYESRPEHQAQADDFLFVAGSLELGVRTHWWLKEGLVSGQIERLNNPDMPAIDDLLHLKTQKASHYDELIGMDGLRWASENRRRASRPAERTLEARHAELVPELRKRVTTPTGWGIGYTTTSEIDNYFLEWGRLYLGRMFGSDMLGPTDIIGGRPYSRWQELLAVLSGRAQKHIAYSALLKARHPELHIRNLLTAHAPIEPFTRGVASQMGADYAEIEMMLRSLTLSGENRKVHTSANDPAWAPLIQASADSFILPIYGIDINPHLFLLDDLKARFANDWFRAVNNRETRWIEELTELFSGARWKTNGRNLRLRDGSRDQTDIDFALLDTRSQEIALFQLKWLHPAGMDNRLRRNTAGTLVDSSNAWVETTLIWVEKHGSRELAKRLGFDVSQEPKIRLFVIGRYHAHLSGYDEKDNRAVWSDWANFLRILGDGAMRSPGELARDIRRSTNKMRSQRGAESFAFPLQGLGVMLNGGPLRQTVG